MLKRIGIVAVTVAGMIGAGPVVAQDWTLDPAYGTFKLQSGLDPFVFDLLAGGEMNAADTIGGGCLGFVAEAPDLRVQFTASSGAPLTFSVESPADTTLVISDPEGNWICDDDSGGDFNPRVVVDNPMSGQYDIWVGTYVDGDFEDATLTIAEGAPEADAGQINPGLSPTYGTFDLAIGFEPDPFTFDLEAGGALSAFELLGCAGFVANAPDLRINYQAGGASLYIAARSDGDTTLVISDPAGNWICDDDSGGNFDPSIVIDAPISGAYNVWVGTYVEGELIPATLYVSEVAAFGTGALNWDLDPEFGEVTLEAGFQPNPYEVGVIAGGPLDAGAMIGTCRGYVGEAPDFRIFYGGGALPLSIFVTSDDDTTLVIADPDGNWFCNDDTDGLNPRVTFDDALEGQYDIWVGTYSPTGQPSATLAIEEVGRTADNDPQTGGVDPSLPPTFGGVELAAGFLPDPFTVDLTAGGSVRARDVNQSCAGLVHEAPDFRLTYEAGAFPLYIFVQSITDPTLMILDPDGNWICDDDGGFVPFAPAVAIDNPVSGDYLIWVGVFGSGDAPATVYISEVMDGRETDPGAPAEEPASPPASPPASGAEPPPPETPASGPLPDGPVFVDP